MPDPQPVQVQQQAPPQEKKGNTAYYLIGILNVAVIVSIFLWAALTKKSAFLKPFLWGIGIFLVVELAVYMIYYLIAKYNSKPKGKKKTKEYTIEEIEIIAEDYLWKKEGIKRFQVNTFINEPRAIEIGGSNIQAYIWHFKDLVGIFKKEYLFACLVNEPQVRGYRKLEKRPDEDFIREYVKSIAKQPTEMRTTRFRRTDPLTQQEIVEETSEPVYQNQPAKEAGKL